MCCSDRGRPSPSAGEGGISSIVPNIWPHSGVEMGREDLKKIEINIKQIHNIFTNQTTYREYIEQNIAVHECQNLSADNKTKHSDQFK